MYLWDVHSKTWDKKHFRLSLQLSEFSLSNISLGFDLHYSKGYLRRLKHYAHFTLDFGPSSVAVYVEWGR